jgi:hypothetical protein
MFYFSITILFLYFGLYIKNIFYSIFLYTYLSYPQIYKYIKSLFIHTLYLNNILEDTDGAHRRDNFL